MKITDRYRTKLRTDRDAVSNELWILRLAEDVLNNAINGEELTEQMTLAMDKLMSQLDSKIERLIEKYAKLTARIVLVDRWTGNLWK
jgi:hypothetical protein